MKQTRTAHPRAIAMLLAAVALPAISASAQDAAPPPVAATVAPPAADPAAAPTPTVQAAPAPVFAPSSPVVQNVPPPGPRTPVATDDSDATAAVAPAAKPRREARLAPRAPTVSQSAPAAPVAAPTLPAPAPGALPSTEQSASPIADPNAAAPVDAATTRQADDATTATASQDVSAQSATPWIIAGAIALGLILFGFIVAGRRRKSVQRAEPMTVYKAAPIAPVAAYEELPVAKPVAETHAVAETRDSRPWLGLSLTPIAVGSEADGDNALVQYELTVENSSDVAAHDVKVSSFLINDARSSSEEASLIDPVATAEVQTIDVLPNGSVPMTSTLHVHRDDITSNGFLPKVVAEVRYPLPDGGEGLFSARFALGMTDGDSIKPVTLDDGVHDDVGAEFEKVLEQA